MRRLVARLARPSWRNVAPAATDRWRQVASRRALGCASDPPIRFSWARVAGNSSPTCPRQRRPRGGNTKGKGTQRGEHKGNTKGREHKGDILLFAGPGTPFVSVDAKEACKGAFCFSRWPWEQSQTWRSGDHARGLACRILPRHILPMSPGSYKVAPPTQKRIASGPVDYVYFRSRTAPCGTDWEIHPITVAGSRRRPAALSQFAVSCCPAGMENVRRWPPFCSSLRIPRRLSPKETASGDRVLWEARSPSSLRPRGIGILVTCQE